MGVGFRASSNVSSLRKELAAAHGEIQELVSNFFRALLFAASLLICFSLLAQMAASEGMVEAVRTQQ